MTKNWIITLLAIICSMLFAICIMFFNQYNPEEMAWESFRKELRSESVTKILILGTRSPIQVNESDKQSFINFLNQATYYKSNIKSEGPTEKYIIQVFFSNGEKQSIGYWYKDIFEIKLAKKSGNAHFLIKSEAFGDYLERIVNYSNE
ncbi:hypothetical protein QJ48_16990 [Paenibacillus sp. A3]|uniref:hypothetical protein n=1 Tax=Paenibacillus sp. A3 TaxID=1337054 RepID=UPI0006D55B07|nr:hypothetical protein [Paenibacillus sp. A3]KPV58362.1 hypothetical protein QJ48_16990 [Paenibacillus sp. A3]